MPSIRAIGSLVFLPLEYAIDWLRMVRWSKASPLSPIGQRLFYDIVLLAHTVEKGLSQPDPRPAFGQEKISQMLGFLRQYDPEHNLFPVEKAYGALTGYIDWHEKQGLEMGPITNAVRAFVDQCHQKGITPKGGTRLLDPEQYDVSRGERTAIENLEMRYSCRRFLNQVVPIEQVRKTLSIAQRSPSQCNRQATRVHCYQDKDEIVRLLNLQMGAKGFSEAVYNLFVITSDMVAWSGSNARNQAFVDASLFAMQLSLACNATGLGTCALNLAASNSRERKIRAEGNIPHSERLVMMMAFGEPDWKDGSLVVAHSERLPVGTALIEH